MLMILITGACVEPYDPPLNDGDIQYLVVDGFINASNGIATVKLSRTLPVKSPDKLPSESGAFVALEDDQGTTYPLSETRNGLYRGLVSDISLMSRYRLLIRTNQKIEYFSEFIEVKKTPAIDSIHYVMARDGMDIVVNTHDVTGKTIYFRWTYVETYEYNSRFNSNYMFKGKEVVVRPNNLSIYTCWKTNLSTNIMIGSTARLKESVISNFPLTFIPQGSIKISRKYSLFVQQQSLTEQAYNYWLNLQKNTEGLGGLFDPLPSEATGNIYSASNPGEKVIGFFSGGSVEETRIFLTPDDLPKEMNYNNYSSYCLLDTILLQDVGRVASEGTLLVDGISSLMGPGLIGYSTSSSDCIDCISSGGNTQRPDFWE